MPNIYWFNYVILFLKSTSSNINSLDFSFYSSEIFEDDEKNDYY